mmetsp:Transcript_16765/g.47959  ORF Transcript_16765/g.47959 Transcript_16765/m.47959 type:complete len:226 (-) Transcript_16765:180-857(-)
MEQVQRLRNAILRDTVVHVLARGDELVQLDRLAQCAAHGAHNHDAHVVAASPSLAKLGHEQLSEEEGRQVIRGELRLVALLRRPELLGGHDAGVVDEIVKRQTQGEELPHERPDGGEVVQVDLQDRGLARELLLGLQSAQHLLGLLGAPHREHDMTPILHQHPGVLRPEPARGAGDDGHPPLQRPIAPFAQGLLCDLLAREVRVREALEDEHLAEVDDVAPQRDP